MNVIYEDNIIDIYYIYEIIKDIIVSVISINLIGVLIDVDNNKDHINENTGEKIDKGNEQILEDEQVFIDGI